MSDNKVEEAASVISDAVRNLGLDPFETQQALDLAALAHARFCGMRYKAEEVGDEEFAGAVLDMIEKIVRGSGGGNG